MENNLPKGWIKVELEQCCDILDNIRIPVNSDERTKRQGTVPYYGATGKVGWINDFLFNEELVLIGEDGAPFYDKSKNIAYIINGKSWVNNHAHVLRAKEVTSNKFLNYFLNNFDYNGYVNGTTRLKLTQGKLKVIPVLLPPLPEQQRIVEKLDALMARISNSKTRLEKIPTLLKNFRQSVLAAAVSGELTKEWRKENLYIKPHIEQGINFLEDDSDIFEFPEKWRAIKLSELTDFVTSGSRGWAKYYSDKGSTFIRAQNINSDVLNLDDIAYVELPNNAEGLRTKVQKNDILITITGANVAKSALVNEYIDDAYVSQHVGLVRLSDTELGKFIYYGIIAPNLGRKQLLDAAYGQGKPGLNLDNIKSLIVGVPPLEEQKEIVRKVEELFQFADSIEARYQKAKAWYDKIPQAILAKAFRGELVPQNEEDEPASELLERIKKEKQNTITKTKSAAKKKIVI